eukprot:1196404-Prorocentrum_minimum.AAC.6
MASKRASAWAMIQNTHYRAAEQQPQKELALLLGAPYSCGTSTFLANADCSCTQISHPKDVNHACTHAVPRNGVERCGHADS